MSPSALALLLIPVALVVGFLIHTVVRYAPIIGRVFEEKPLFLPLRLDPEPGGEEVRFRTKDGLELQGSYYPAETHSRVGVLVFCHEYLSNRWSFRPYTNALRALGYDIFTFDFRNHGLSASDPDYVPLQWVTNHEVRDLQAALAYLRTRPDHDTAGFGLFGVSRGGGAALLVAAKDPAVWGVVTDGAFPTHGTMLSYSRRWAEIYVSNPLVSRFAPTALFRFANWAGRVRSERRLHCKFPEVERAVARLSPRPWLMIHGQKDAYISPEIARVLFDEAKEPKELWIVPKAKHNRCREVAPEEYAARIVGFLRRFAPRRELPKMDPGNASREDETRAIAPTPNLADPVDLPTASLAGRGYASSVPG